MRAYELLVKKRDGSALTAEEIRFLIDGFMRGNVPDYQMAAFLMAVYFRGMTHEETTALTLALAASGGTLGLRLPGRTLVDKHSTGGVGDKTTLVLVPLVASLGLSVAKMSGTALGHTGGTIDKLESIPGFRVTLSPQEMEQQIEQVGAALVTQTADLTPADKMLYALRDLTATVESIPLVASSIMAKKLATGADAFVFDVKAGRAGLVKTESDGRTLAETMVSIAKGAGKRAAAWVSAMDAPIGRSVGNLLEVEEAVVTLRGQGPPDLVELCTTLAAEMLCIGGASQSPAEAKARAESALLSGKAYERFMRIVEAQGGSTTFIERLPLDPVTLKTERGYAVAEAPAPADGWVAAIDGAEIGLLSMALGAGRDRSDSEIDRHVGVVLHKKVGDRVRSGEPLARVVARDDLAARRACERLAKAYAFSDAEPPRRPLFYARFGDGAEQALRK